jgi:pimeloyl-ACP methyl ester carboxylesterase
VPVNNTKSTEVDVRGGRLSVWTQAGEPTTLVFLHVWGGSHRTFAPVVARLAGNREAQLAWPLGGITMDITAATRAIEVQVQVLAGRQDRVDPPENLEANLLPFIPGARMTVVEGTGHLSPLEVPEQIAKELEQLTKLIHRGE